MPVVTDMLPNDLINFTRGASGPHVAQLQDVAKAMSGYNQATPVSITTVGNGVITAAGMAAGVVLRSGPTANYADAMDTAAHILAAFPGAVVGSSYRFRVVNSVAFTNTVTAGSGNTLAGTTAIAASTWRDYIVTFTNVTTAAATITGIGSGTL